MYTIQEDILKNIIEDYNNGLSVTEISKQHPELSPYKIRENLKKSGNFKSPQITSDELEKIKLDYKLGLSLQQLSEKYHRSDETIKRKLRELDLYNVRTQCPYSDEEIEILYKYYPIADWESLLKYLPNRNIPSIRTKASKLGILQENVRCIEKEITSAMLSKGYILLSKFTNIKNKHDILDADGYKYNINLIGFTHDDYKPKKFSQNNIHTLYNIRHYINTNNIACELISDKYVNNTTNLEWKCHCGNVFTCTFNSFYQGKHQCNKCSKILTKKKKSVPIDDVKQLIKNKPYTMIDETFTSMSNSFSAITDEGYYVLIDRKNIYKDAQPEIFHTNNPYSIKNIKHYIHMNNISTHLISTTYNNNQEPLEWKCKCGKHFKRSWNNFLTGATECSECSANDRGIAHRIPTDEIVRFIQSRGYFLDMDIDNIAISNKKLTLYDKDGYYYTTTWSSLKNNKVPKRFHVLNKYTLQNINHYMKLNRNGEYFCISDNYLGSNQVMKFKHVPCGCEFNATWDEMQGKFMTNKKDKYYKQCPKCNKNKTESIHASILKQVFIHEYPHTSLEDNTCINPKTNRVLPTDIVNHDLKVVVEIQSSYHDTEERKIIDKFKRDFWVNKGYKFYDPDIRNYSILEMIQIFFPKINSMPSYVEYDFSNCIDFTEIQKMLNLGYTISEISNILGIKKVTIQSFITNKKVFLPKNYKRKVFNIKPIVRLSKEGDFIERFESLQDANKQGFTSGTVRRVLIKQQKFSYDSFWVYEEDYLNGNYQIPKIEFDKFTLPVSKYTMDDILICNYDSIYEAEKDSNSNKGEIYRVAIGDRKSSRNEKWKFTNAA